MTVAALFVDPEGVYTALLGAGLCWDAARDGRTYAGPWPVVAHPPCQLWVNFAWLNYARYGGEHNRPGNDRGCFAAALAAVSRFGGVLEHPAFSAAWEAFGLLAPDGEGWIPSGSQEWVCEVWQSAYGHPARKRTWLLYCGERPPLELDWRRLPGSHQVGWFDRKKPSLGKRAASHSPVAFARRLIEIARNSA